MPDAAVNQAHSQRVVAATSLFVGLLIVALLLWAASSWPTSPARLLRSFGLRSPTLFRLAQFVLVAGIVVIWGRYFASDRRIFGRTLLFPSTAIFAGALLVMTGVELPFRMSPWLRDVTRYTVSFETIFQLALIAGTVGLIEEFAMRGVVQKGLREWKRLPAILNIILTAVVFTMLHIDGTSPSALVAIFVIACYIGWIFHLTGSLFVAATLHAIGNFVLFLLNGLAKVHHGILAENAQGTTTIGVVAFATVLFTCIALHYRLRVTASE